MADKEEKEYRFPAREHPSHWQYFRGSCQRDWSHRRKEFQGCRKIRTFPACAAARRRDLPMERFPQITYRPSDSSSPVWMLQEKFPEPAVQVRKYADCPSRSNRP
jgi:hypothetical protein